MFEEAQDTIQDVHSTFVRLLARRIEELEERSQMGQLLHAASEGPATGLLGWGLRVVTPAPGRGLRRAGSRRRRRTGARLRSPVTVSGKAPPASPAAQVAKPHRCLSLQRELLLTALAVGFIDSVALFQILFIDFNMKKIITM